MTGQGGPGRGVMRLLRAMARAGARIEVDTDEKGEVEAARVVSGAGAMPDVLCRVGREVWAEAVSARAVARTHDGRWEPTALSQHLLGLARERAGGGEAACEAVLAGAPGAHAAETARPARPVENIAESPLAWLRRRRDRNGQAMISDTQFEAGERLRADFERGELSPRITVDWSALGSGRSRVSGGSAAVELRDAVVAARERVARTFEAVGPEMARVLLDVCCHLKGLEQLEREAGWPQRSGKVVLQLALDALARHYRIDRGGTETGRAGVIRHWAPGEYRPTIGDR